MGNKMQSLFKTAILGLAGLVAVTAFTLDTTPFSQPQAAQAASISTTCPSTVRVSANLSAPAPAPPGINNKFSYSISAVSNRSTYSTSISTWLRSSTSTQTLESPYMRRSLTAYYNVREITGYTPVYRTDRVRVAPYSGSATRWVYSRPSPWAPGRWIPRTTYYPVYNYENRRVFVRNNPVYGNVPYPCNVTVTWFTGERKVDVIHAENFFVSSPSRMPDGSWQVRATHVGSDNLTGNISIPVNGHSVPFRFSGGKTATEYYSPGRLISDFPRLNADIRGFSPGHRIENINQRNGSNILSRETLTFIHDMGSIRQSTSFRGAIKATNSSFSVGPPNIIPSLGGAKSNWSISKDQQVAPYAAAYSQMGRVAPCRVNMANPDLPFKESESVRVAASDLHRNETLFAAGDGYALDYDKTFAANPWLQLNSANVDGRGFYKTNKTNTYNPFTGRIGTKSVPKAVGKTATLYFEGFSESFINCYLSLAGAYPQAGYQLYEKVDLTGGHPARVNYIFMNGSFSAVSGGSGFDPSRQLSSIQCLPESRGVNGIDVYDAAQGHTNNIYGSLFASGANRLNRDNFNASYNINSNNSYFGDMEGDFWVTGFSPATSRYAPGARNPRASVQCDYAKRASATVFDWERNNMYLGSGKNPVYVGDTITVNGANTQKVGDPGRKVLGSVTVRISGPGYSQTRTCANPCGSLSFPAITQAGTHTITASWGGDAGLNGSSSSRAFVANKYNTQLSFTNPMLNNQGVADFTSTKPVPIRNTHLQNTSIAWIPTVPAGDMGSGTLQVTVQQLQSNGSWANYASTTTNANCLMSSNPCASEVGAIIVNQGQYRVQLRYIGNNKYNASTAAWSNTFWVYEDFRCVGINNADGVSMQLEWFENNTQKTAFSGNVLRNGNPMIISHPSVDGSGFTGIVRLDKIETSSYFMGTPLADGTNVRLFEMPAGLSTSDLNKLLRGEYAPSLREYSLKPGMPSSSRYIFDNVRTYNSWPLNDAGGFKTVVRVYEISDLTDPGLKMMQELRVYGIYYKDGVRQTGSIACEDVDAPQTGFLKFNKVTIIQ